MRILYISSKKGWGGIVTWMHRTALGLEERGHRVWILSHPESRFTKSAPAGIRLIPKKLGMDFNPAMILYLVGFIKRHKIDLVLTNIQKEVVIGGLAARVSGIPNVRRIGNEYDLNDRVRWRQRHLVNHSIVPCEFTLDAAVRRLSWIERDLFTVIYNGVNPAEYSPEDRAVIRHEWGVPVDAKVIGCTSSLGSVKGLEGLITAFGRVATDHPEIHLVLSGEGPEETALKRVAEASGVSDRVVFAGFTAEPTRAAAAYDIAVLNSEVEGFPNAVVEYMAAGTPVVSTRVGGVPEILTDGRNGLLIEPGDLDALVAGLRSLLADPELRRQLGEKARLTVEEGFSEAGMVDRVEALFKKTIGVRAA
jgi:glycosyltransferase involved in cell wall biosynthesis